MISFHHIVCDFFEFRCDSGQCVDDDYECDGTTDCIDGSDEDDCCKYSISSFIACLYYNSHIQGTERTLIISLNFPVMDKALSTCTPPPPPPPPPQSLAFLILYVYIQACLNEFVWRG